MELRGFELCIFSLRHPYDPASHPIHAEIEAPVYYLPEYVHEDVARVLRAFLRNGRKPGFWKALGFFVRDLWRDPTRNRMRRFAQAQVLACEVPATVQHYYTHFMHTPASVSHYAAMISRRSWSISAHAKDIWTTPAWEIREKLRAADWVVTCTAANDRYLSQLGGDDKVELLYHGLDFNRFDEPKPATERQDGSTADSAVRLISVGRAVDKKGYEYLLAALAALPRSLHWHFVHIGGGELLSQLQQQANKLGIDDRIEWLGGLPQTEVLARYRDADLFVLPSKISEDGDRDGLPNVLMEAQSQQLACLSTRVSGIPELIIHAETGWLVEQKDTSALAQALETLMRDPQLRQRLGLAGFERVRQHFSMDRGIDTLVERLRQSLVRD